MRSKLDGPTLVIPGLIPYHWMGILYMEEVKIHGGLKVFNTEGPVSAKALRQGHT